MTTHNEHRDQLAGIIARTTRVNEYAEVSGAYDAADALLAAGWRKQGAAHPDVDRRRSLRDVQVEAERRWPSGHPDPSVRNIRSGARDGFITGVLETQDAALAAAGVLAGQGAADDDTTRLRADGNLARVLADITAERRAQDAKWGEQNHDPALWLAILTEEVGELAQAVLAHTFGKVDHGSHSQDLRTEAIQIGAVAVAFVQFLDRHKSAADAALLEHVDDRLAALTQVSQPQPEPDPQPGDTVRVTYEASYQEEWNGGHNLTGESNWNVQAPPGSTVEVVERAEVSRPQEGPQQ